MAHSSLLDPLYCQEDYLDEEPLLPDQPQQHEHEHPLLICDDDDEWDHLSSFLSAKEAETHHHLSPPSPSENPYLGSARREAVEWVTMASAHHGFSALTVVLTVNYLDRCFLSSTAGVGLRLQGDKPWMSQLAAVACLSLAAKVEETHVPFLMDLQVEGTRYVFEARTIQRMELLVLSTLGWRVNPVTPISFTHHIVSRLAKEKKGTITTTTHLRDLLRRCDASLLSVIADWRWVLYPASVLAAAALLHAVELDSAAIFECEIKHLIALLNIPKESVEGCYQLMMECVVDGNKRKFQWICSNPSSPKGVIGSCFSCDSSSNDSWAVWSSSVSSSPEPPFKRPNCITTSTSNAGEE